MKKYKKVEKQCDQLLSTKSKRTQKRQHYIIQNKVNAQQIYNYVLTNMKHDSSQTPSNIKSLQVDMMNQGKLLLVHENFKGWSEKLINEIESLFSTPNIRLLKGNLIGISWKTIYNKTHIKLQFCTLCNHDLNQQQTDLLFEVILRKTYNVYAKALMNKFSINLSKTKGSFRGDLKATEHNNEVKKKKNSNINDHENKIEEVTSDDN